MRSTVLWTIAIGLSLCLAVVGVGTLTAWGNGVRLSLAETIASTRHFTYARYLTSPSEYQQIVRGINNTPVINTGVSQNIHVSGGGSTTSGAVQWQPISGPGYNGWVMLVHNPQLVRLVQAKVQGAKGEYITDMAQRVGAVAGVNASGFEDPAGNGWGGIPVGLELINNQVVNPMRTDNNWTDVGFTADGIMVMGQYTFQQLQTFGVRDAMQFHPELVVGGKPMITVGDGGWGYDPRTAIGQASDGTVIFVVINGRFRNGSGGASQRQVMDLMLHYGAVNACAMDGGSSSVLYANHKILNASSTIDPNGQRHLPDAWLIFPSVSAANSYAH